MISAKVVESEKQVIVDVSGYISSSDAKRFISEYKQTTKGLKTSTYKLVVNTSMFECQSKDDIKSICMAFYKSSYRGMYLVDPNNYIMNTMSLSSLEKRMFTKAVKVVSSVESIR